MKKRLIDSILVLGLSVCAIGCDFDFTVDPPPSAWRQVSGILTERDSGNPISGVQIHAFECNPCDDVEHEEDCPKNYASTKSKGDGTFYLSYFGPPEFTFNLNLPTHPKYNYSSVNGKQWNNHVHVQDSVFLDVKLW